MPKKTKTPDTILPTAWEEHIGEVWDPRGHEEELVAANALLLDFVKAMSTGMMHAHTLKDVQDAFGTLGHFAGYPREAHETEMYLESALAASSYKSVSQILPSCMEDMNSRIKKRFSMLSSRESTNTSAPKSHIDDSEIPFPSHDECGLTTRSS